MKKGVEKKRKVGCKALLSRVRHLCFCNLGQVESPYQDPIRSKLWLVQGTAGRLQLGDQAKQDVSI